MKNNSYENFFANFSNPTRISILNVLAEKSLSVNEIARKINEEQSNVSHQLKHLTKCKILNVKQQGKRRIYSLNKKTVEPMLKLAGQHIHGNCFSCCGDCSKCFQEGK